MAKKKSKVAATEKTTEKEAEKEQVEDNENSDTEDDAVADKGEAIQDGKNKMESSEIDAANLLGPSTAPPPKRAASVAADANMRSPKKHKVKEEAAPTSDTALLKAIYNKVVNIDRSVDRLLSIGVRNTEHVVDLTRLEGKLDAAVATAAAIPIKAEASAVDVKAATAFVESALMTATAWPNFGGNEFWISKQRAALGPLGATNEANTVCWLHFFLLLCLDFFFRC